MKKLARLAAVVLALGAAAFGLWRLYQATEPVHLAELAEVQASRRSILHLDSEVKRQALEARYGMLNQYDGLVRSAAALEEAVVQYRRSLDRTVSRAPGMDAAFDALEAQVAAQRGDLERFKSNNSILKNSLRYLPAATLDLLRAASAPGERALREAGNEVLIRTFMFGAFRGQDEGEHLERALTTLAAELAKQPPSKAPAKRVAAASAPRRSNPERAKLVLLHGRVCLDQIRTVERVLAGMRERPLAAALAEVDGIFSAEVARMEARASQLQVVLYALLGLLAMLLVAAGYGLSRLYATLEQKVEARTRDLREAHASMQRLYDSNRLVLENVEQGLLTIGLDGALGTERSAAADRWFGRPDPSDRAPSWLGRHDATFAAYLELVLEQLREDFLPETIVLDQLPSLLRSGDRTYVVRLTPIPALEGRRFEQLLVTVKDVTDELARAADEKRQREVVALARRVAKDRQGALELIEDVQRLLAALRDAPNLAVAKRQLHTLKGNAALQGLEHFSARCHALETRLEESGEAPSSSELDALEATWQALEAEVQPFIGADDQGAVRLQLADLAELRAALAGDAGRDEVLALVDGWSLEPMESRLRRMGEHLAGIARRLGRRAPEVVVDAPARLRTDPEQLRDLWSSMVHVLRNTVDHGLEPADERTARGKRASGRVRLGARRVGERLELLVEDDGRGVDWDRVRDLAQSRGLPAATQEDLSAALFADGLSTRTEITETSGRGVGMSAVRQAVEALGGQVHVESTLGQGTRVLVRLPWPVRAVVGDRAVA